MGTQEEEERVHAQAGAHFATVLGEWKSHQVELTKEESGVSERIGQLVSERGQLSNQLPAQSRSAYERLRGTRRGLAVANHRSQQLRWMPNRTTCRNCSEGPPE